MKDLPVRHERGGEGRGVEIGRADRPREDVQPLRLLGILGILGMLGMV